MNEYQKASLEVVKDVSVQLMLIAVGVFALAGSFLAAQNGAVQCKGLMVSAFSFFILSVLGGLAALGNAVAQLNQSRFNVYDPLLRAGYFGQLVCLLIGGVCFAFFLVVNIK